MDWHQLYHLLAWPSILIFCCAYTARRVLIIIQRLFFHPLSSFPGPKIAGASSVYRMYYSIWKSGEMLAQIRLLHKEYGPIVRIGPNELHFSNPEVYHSIYASSKKFTKDPHFYATFAQESAIFGIISPSAHKLRRNLLSPLFSRRATLGIEPLIQAKVDKFCMRLSQRYSKGKASNMCLGYSSMTIDIINELCYGKCLGELEALRDDAFESPLVMSTRSSINWTIWMYRDFPWVREVVVQLPERLASIITPSNTWTIMMMKLIDSVLHDPSICNESPHPTIFGRLLNPDLSKGQILPSREALIQEAMGFVMAGSIELTNALTYGTFHVLNDPKIIFNLVQELASIWPDPDQTVRFEVLEKLPYLTGVVKESLRLTHGAVSGLPRVVPEGGVELDGVQIPGGTIVSISATYLHLDESVYPRSQEFIPERWIGENYKDNLNRNLVSFSRGPRQCIATTLAYMELYMAFANVFKKFDMKLHNTGPEDFIWKEFFGPVFINQPLHVFTKLRR